MTGSPTTDYLSKLDGGLLRLTFNRPDQGNMMPLTSLDAMTEQLCAAKRDKSVRCLLIDAVGKVFSAGGDVRGFAKSLEEDASACQADFRRRLDVLNTLVVALADFDRPIVVSLRGAAAGAGLVYPLAADYVIGDATAMFVFAHQKIGLTPDAGTTYFLPQVVGMRMARTLLLSAATVDATEAHRLGLVTRIVSAESLVEDSLSIARRLADAPQRAVVSTKRLIHEAASRSLPEQLVAEKQCIADCIMDADFAEGVKAFLEKRRPKFPSARIAE